ncbi:MAG TPA: DNA primase [Dehalococcoidia bacterium]|nr:DNA primase [Dehalococcoidia bacterium]
MSAVDEVKAKLDIVDVVGSYVRLQKAGRQFKANCPFHNEKTPSFYVNPDRQSWHCFGACGTGGDVIAFVSRKENLDFAGALRLLAERAGVELHNEGPRRQELKTLQDANEAAAVYFHGLLQTSAVAKAYAESRGLDAKTIGDFQIGYAAPGWEGLRNHLTSRGFKEAQLVEVGLLIDPSTSSGRADTGRPYDRFRDRLIYPIRDDRGRVAGFGGRVMPPTGPGQAGDASQPGAKYVNTPMTSLFDKGSILYGLDRAKDEIRSAGVAVIVEGYMDVIAAHQAGFRNVVASMGTALTEKQAALLQRFAERVVLAMDADEAGSAANLRAIQVVAASERPTRVAGRPKTLDIRVLALPMGKDPDELVRSNPEAWPQAVEAAKPVVDHLIAVVSAGLDLSQPLDRSRLVTEVLPAIGEVVDPVLRAHYLQRLSRLARVSEDALRRELPRRSRSRATAPAANSTVAVGPGRRLSGVPRAREQFCLALLYRAPELRPEAESLQEALFELSENRELFRRWRDEEIVSEEEGELWEHYQSIVATRIPFTETAQLRQALLDCVERLQRGTIKAVKEASALALAEGEAGVRPGRVASIARARMGAGIAEETVEDGPAEAVASQLLEDMEAGLRFHRRLIEGSRPDQESAHAAE